MLREGRILTLLFERIFNYLYRVLFKFRLKRIVTMKNLNILILHPQLLGMHKTIEFIHNSPADIYMYILDNSYFCVRSYNHLPASNGPCMQCLGGNLLPQKENDCQPFPARDSYAAEYIRELRRLVQAGRVKLLAQCESQAALAKSHFGVDVPVVGLWASDWDDVFENNKRQGADKDSWDVVLHGFSQDAKGASWLLEVASYCPELKFLFPFPKLWLLNHPYKDNKNCIFRYLKWEEGLQEEVARARMVVVPSLWSAAIEGSLVKSLVIAKAVAVVHAKGAFSMELPDELLLKLPADPAQAATALKTALDDNWQPQQQLKQRWADDFEKRNRNTMKSILDHIQNSTIS
jgi:hypothetical protein